MVIVAILWACDADMPVDCKDLLKLSVRRRITWSIDAPKKY